MDSTIDNLLTSLRKYRSQLCRQHIDSQMEQLYKSKSISPNDPLFNRPSKPIVAIATTSTSTINTTTTTTITTSNSTSTTATITTSVVDQTATTTTSTLSATPTSLTHPTPINTPSKLSSELATIDCFLSNIKHLEKYDSEATESTSSDDSYDELEDFSHQDIPPKRRIFQNQQTSCSSSKPSSQHYNHHHPSNQSSSHGTSSNLYNTTMPNSPQDYANLKKKAIWKWANERSRLACRWTWLQAQVADLEFRIRGQNDATIHARAYKTPALPPKVAEHSCSRTVPINKDFRRRRLIKSTQILSDSNRKSVKYSHIPCVCSSLPQTVAPCLSCNGRYNYLKQIDGENLPISERISLLDPCCHPVLSFPDDLTLGLQLSYLLKQETINRKPTKGKPGRKKGSTAANLAAAAAAAASTSTTANGASSSGDNNQVGRKGKFYGLVGRPPGKQSQTMITSNKLRRKYRKHSNNTNNYNSNNWAIGSTTNNPSSRNTIRRNKRIRRASSMNESSMYTGTSNNHYHHHHPHYTRPNYCSNNNNSSAQNVTRRRRSEQSAYDIDNIVIPFSIAATTRVEVLEYKEIMTPSWRIWENGTSNHNQTENDVNEDIEDTSDEAYINRHSKGESEEKKRFSLKPPKNTTTSNSNNAPTTPTITTNSTTNNMTVNTTTTPVTNTTTTTTNVVSETTTTDPS